MNKRIILFLAPALFLYTVFMLIPAYKTLFNFFINGHSIFTIDNSILDIYKKTFVLCTLNAIFQIGLTLLSGYLMIRTKEGFVYAKLALIYSFVPIVATTTAFLYFVKFNFGAESFVSNYIGVNLFEFITHNEYVIMILISFFSAVQWIGLQSLLCYFLVKDTPKEIYDIAKIDGISGFMLLFKILQHYIRPVIGIFTFSIIISSLKIYEVSKVFSHFLKQPRTDLFWLWNKSYNEGNTELTNYIAVILWVTTVVFALLILLGVKIFRMSSINDFNIRKYLKKFAVK